MAGKAWGAGAASMTGAAWTTGTGPSFRMRKRMSPASNSNSWKGSRPTRAMSALISSRPRGLPEVVRGGVALGVALRAAGLGAGAGFLAAADFLREVLIRAPTIGSSWGRERAYQTSLRG